MNASSLSHVARSFIKLLSITAMTVPATACVVDGEEPGGLDVAAEEAEVFTRTIVTLHDDGTETVELREVTLDAQLGDQHLRELRLAGEREGLGTAVDAISRDSGCASAAIWVFDQANLTGNEICFVGAGTVDLEAHCLNSACSDRWGQNVRSYWAGADSGLFSFSAGYTCGSSQGTCLEFAPFQRWNTVSSCEQRARYLSLQRRCVPA